MANHVVMLVDSSRLLKEGLKRLLEPSEFSVQYEVSCLPTAIEVFPDDSPPDIALIEWPETQRESDCGTEFRTLKARAPNTHLVVLSQRLCLKRLATALHNGASGFLVKDISPSALIGSLRLVLLGETVLPSGLSKHLEQTSGDLPNGETEVSDRTRISPRERMILALLTQGAPNKVIAHRLGMSEGTVKVHLKSLLKKINAKNRTQAAIWALAHPMEHNLPGETDNTREGKPVPGKTLGMDRPSPQGP